MFGHRNTQNAISWPKCPWSTLGWPKVKGGQNHPKTTFFIFLHQTRATWWFSLTWTKFDLRLTPKGFNIVILIWPLERLGPTSLQRLLNSFSNDYSWVEIGAKTVEISWKLCIVRQLASRCYNFWSGRRNFNFFNVMKTKHPKLSRYTKIKLIQTRKGLQKGVQSRWLLSGCQSWKVTFCL